LVTCKRNEFRAIRKKFLRNILTGLIEENILFQLKHHAILEKIFLIAGQS
jgi:hypothetical protein